MNWNAAMRYFAYGVLLGVYGIFAWFGKASVDVFLTLVTGALAALGTAHISEIAAPKKEVPPQETPKDSSDLFN